MPVCRSGYMQDEDAFVIVILIRAKMSTPAPPLRFQYMDNLFGTFAFAVRILMLIYFFAGTFSASMVHATRSQPTLWLTNQLLFIIFEMTQQFGIPFLAHFFPYA